MYGKVTRYFQERGYGFILGDDNATYFIHCSNLGGECIERGYHVHFQPFRNGRSDYNAKDVIVIDVPEKKGEEMASHNRKKKHRSHKPCNADRVAMDDRKFKKFVRAFLEGQEAVKNAV